MKVLLCNRANTCQPRDTTGQGGQHTRSWQACAQQVSILAVKKLVLARTVKLAQEATPPDMSAQAPRRRPHALLLYLLQLLCEQTRACQCLQPSLQTDFTGYLSNCDNVVYKQLTNYALAKKAGSVRHPLGSPGQWNTPGWMGAAVDSSSHLPALCLWDQKPRTRTSFILICLLFVFYFGSGTI